MKNLYTPNVDLTTVDNLLSGTLVACKVIAGQMEEGNGILKRGTLLTVDEDGVYAKAESDDDVFGILLLDIDTDDEDECAGAVIACSGEFNQNKIEEVMDASVATATILGCRTRQIYIAPMERAPETF